MHPTPTLAVTLGDPAGVGPELALHLTDNLARRLGCGLRIIGDPALLAKVSSGRFTPSPHTGDEAPRVTLDCPHAINTAEHRWGAIDAANGEAAFAWLSHAIDLALGGEIAGIVTLPLCKESLHLAGHHYPGHTDILAERAGVDSYAMMLYSETLRIAHVTLHTSVRHALEEITVARILAVVRLGHDMMTRLLGRPPRIAICALNPHAGEGGAFGREEIEIIRPAIDEAVRAGMPVEGPLPADTVFAAALGGRFDLVVAMLHDHGHVAFKTALFRLGPATRTSGVNVTLGLPFVRTSVDHGTAFDIAGQGVADAGSLFDALELAARLCHAPALS